MVICINCGEPAFVLETIHMGEVVIAVCSCAHCREKFTVIRKEA